MIAHMLTHANRDCTAFLGGIAQNYASNMLLANSNATMVVEADEFDRSFLTLHPNIAVVTSMDADHLDIYGQPEQLAESFSLYAQRLEDNGVLIYKKGLPLKKPANKKSVTYSIDEVADYHAPNITVDHRGYTFDVVHTTGHWQGLRLGMPGRHNIENALAAIASTREIGLEEDEIREALESFQGVKRRFEYIIQRPDLVFIDDYAHPPEELQACIRSARELYPGKKLTGVFQPHLYSRTRDFEEGFARALELLVEVLLLDIYPAREQPIPGVTSEHLLGKIQKAEKSLVTKGELVKEIASRSPEVLLTLGAGDIDQLVQPIRQALLQPTESA